MEKQMTIVDREIETLNRIYNYAVDESFSEHEALIAIVNIVEARLADFGMFPEGDDPNRFEEDAP